jgi:hypothetical protein
MAIERTPQPSPIQSYIEKGQEAEEMQKFDDTDEPIEIIIGPEDGEEVFGIEVTDVEAPSFDANLAEFMDESELQALSSTLLDDYDNDRAARKEWEQTYVDGLDLLGLKIEERSEPWNGACGVYHPMLTEAAIRFQSEMIAETFPAQGPVKARIIGVETREKQQAAARVVADMNYQLTEKMPEFRPEHEKMLWSLALAGAAFKKTYYDPTMGRPTSVFVPAEDIYIPYGSSSANTAERITHSMRKTKNELKKLQYNGFYRDIDLGEPSKNFDPIQRRKDEDTGFSALNDDRYHILEVQTELDLAGFEDTDEDGEQTGIALPYVVTLEKGTGEVLAIRRNYDEYDDLKAPLKHIVQYTYIPGFGAYGYGLIHLIGGFASSATSIIRQLVDAGTLSNLPGGLKTNGLRIKGDDTPIMPGEWRDVDVASGTVRDNIMPLPYKEPSATLFQLLQNVVEEGRRLASVADVKFDAMSGEAPVGTTLAILERTLKVMSAVQARVHASMAQEFKLIAGLIRDYTAPDYSYEPSEDTSPSAKKADYEQTEITPVSDPNATTMAQRIIQYQAAIQLAQQSPQIYNLPLLHRQMLEVMGIKDADKIVEVEEDIVNTDPVTENMQIVKMKPVKAFIEQDHEAHIQVHQSFMQDPLVAQMMGQNPQAQAIMQAAQAHLAEHLGFAYRRRIEAQLGVALPPPDEHFDPELEKQIAPLLAQAAAQVSQQSAMTVQQQQATQQAQDPVFQQQQMELQLKQQELQMKAEVEMAKIQTQKEIAVLDNQTKLQIEEHKSGRDGFKTGFDAVKEYVAKEGERAQGRNEKEAERAYNSAEKEKDRRYADGGMVDKLSEYANKGNESIAGLAGQEEAVRYATDMAKKTYPGEGVDDRADALRHLLWQGAVAQEQGSIPAAITGYGHEIGLGMLPPQAPDTEMDLENNELGRQLGAQTKTREELLDAAIEAVNAGRARTLNKSKKGEYE